MFLLLCELAVHFCIAVCLQKSDNTVIIRQPLGFQACDELCSTFDGCQSPKYDSVQLRCSVEIETVRNKSCSDVQPITNSCTAVTRYYRTLHARKKGLRKITWKVSRYKTANTKGPSEHLTTGNPSRLTTSKNKEGGHLSTTGTPLRLTALKNTEGGHLSTTGTPLRLTALKNTEGGHLTTTGTPLRLTALKNTEDGHLTTTENPLKLTTIKNKEGGPRRRRKNVFLLDHSSTAMTWYSGRGFCNSSGLILAMPMTKRDKNQVEYILLKNVYHSADVKCLWLGLRDDNGNKTFVWINGSPFMYTKFCWGKPKSYYGKARVTCGKLNVDTFNNLNSWSGVPCDAKCHVLCQRWSM